MALTLHGTVSDNTVALDRKTATPIVINGDMQVAQRGTSLTSQTGTAFQMDRFGFQMDTFGTWTMSQADDGPTGSGFTHALKWDCTSADTSLGAGHFGLCHYRIEGQDLQQLKKGTSSAEKVTVSFWVKSAKTGTYILELFDVDNSRQISQAYTISSADTWEKKIMIFDGDTTGALGNDNGNSLALSWWLGAGSTYSGGTLNTSWAANNNANRAVGVVNLADSTDNDWYLTGVQIEIGEYDLNSLPPFQHESYADSLKRCQRYFHTGVAGDGSTSGYALGGFRTANTAQFLHQFPVTMRTEPTAAQIATDNMICHDLADGNNINVDSIQSVLHNCESNILIQYTLESSSGSAGDSCYLYPTGSTPGVTFSSEL